MPDTPEQSVALQVIRYLSDRSRIQQGGWVSVADVRGAVGAELDQVRLACLALHERGLAELMGGFPIRPTTDKFTLARLTPEGIELAADSERLEAALGPPARQRKKA